MKKTNIYRKPMGENLFEGNPLERLSKRVNYEMFCPIINIIPVFIPSSPCNNSLYFYMRIGSNCLREDKYLTLKSFYWVDEYYSQHDFRYILFSN